MTRPVKLTMPNGHVLEAEYPSSQDWGRSWSIRYPDTGRVGTTGEQDWEIVENYGLTAILTAALSHPAPAEPVGLREEIAALKEYQEAGRQALLAAIDEGTRYKNVIDHFVEDFENDFVVDGQIVDAPDPMLKLHYILARQALATHPSQKAQGDE